MFAKVKALLSSPDRWTRGCLARDSEGEPTNLFGPDAVCWCLVGAIRKVEPDLIKNLFAVRKLKALLGGREVVDFNDSNDYDAVMKLLDQAIEKEKQ